MLADNLAELHEPHKQNPLQRRDKLDFAISNLPSGLFHNANQATLELPQQ